MEVPSRGTLGPQIPKPEPAQEATALPKRVGEKAESAPRAPPSLTVTGQLGSVMKEPTIPGPSWSKLL